MSNSQTEAKNKNMTELQAAVRDDFDYCEVTGLLTRKAKSGRNRGRGSNGYIMSNGYLSFTWNKKTWLAAHLVWVYHHGYKSTQEIDHINQRKLDNRIENLREVNRSQNNLNRTRSFRIA